MSSHVFIFLCKFICQTFFLILPRALCSFVSTFRPAVVFHWGAEGLLVPCPPRRNLSQQRDLVLENLYQEKLVHKRIPIKEKRGKGIPNSERSKCMLHFVNSPLSHGGHIVPRDQKSFVLPRLASLHGFDCEALRGKTKLFWSPGTIWPPCDKGEQYINIPANSHALGVSLTPTG